MIPRTRTSLFNIYTCQTAPNHHTTTKVQNTEKCEFSGWMLTPPHHHHKNTTTSPHHHNLAKHRIVLVLGPDASTCLLSCRLKGRDTTDQNIFVISELLMRIIAHHTSSTYTHRRVRDVSVSRVVIPRTRASLVSASC